MGCILFWTATLTVLIFLEREVVVPHGEIEPKADGRLIIIAEKSSGSSLASLVGDEGI